MNWGIIFFVMGEFKPLYHVVWHMVVLLAATLVWLAVYFYVMPMDLEPKSWWELI